MYRHNVLQPEFEDFYLPFGGRLRSDNRWVKLAKMLPWDEIEADYAAQFSDNKMGAPALSARVAVGALIIKEMQHISDEESVEQIRENPYLQYFLGFREYSDETPFDPSMYVHFRKRLAPVMARFNDRISACAKADSSENKKRKNESDDDHSTPGGGSGSANQGQLLLDATCTPADITYPTDLKLLNEAREKTEKIIDKLYEVVKGKELAKPRTYRKKARKHYLAAARSRHLVAKKRRRAVGRQLAYVRRNLNSINMLLENSKTSPLSLSRYEYKCLLVINELHRQQQHMYKSKTCQIDDRIVSISQPHVRPIIRGKAGAKVEFGAKVAASLVDGYVRFDHISWDAMNESRLLETEVEKYRERYGCYPESIHVDKIYRNRENLRFCKERNIRMSGPTLGRPAKVTEENREELEAAKLMARQDELNRIPVEGKFGQGKRRFGLARIMAKLADTSITAIIIGAVVMNLTRWLKSLFAAFFQVVARLVDDIISLLQRRAAILAMRISMINFRRRLRIDS